MRRHFRNELGNDIDIEVIKRETEGVDGIYISMTGPDSTTENHITKEEANVLYDLLGQALGWKR